MTRLARRAVSAAGAPDCRQHYRRRQDASQQNNTGPLPIRRASNN